MKKEKLSNSHKIMNFINFYSKSHQGKYAYVYNTIKKMIKDATKYQPRMELMERDTLFKFQNFNFLEAVIDQMTIKIENTGIYDQRLRGWINLQLSGNRDLFAGAVMLLRIEIGKLETRQEPTVNNSSKEQISQLALTSGSNDMNEKSATKRVNSQRKNKRKNLPPIV